MSALLHFWQTHAAELARLVAQHVVLVVVSTGAAALVGIPAGILAFHRPRLGRPLLFVANVAQTIPSLALFGFLLPLPFIGGIGPRTALVDVDPLRRSCRSSGRRSAGCKASTGRWSRPASPWA